VTAPGEHAGRGADAAVTATPGCTLAVRTADCAPIVLVGERAVGVVHAGWRGLAAGVVARAAAAMGELGDAPVEAHLGPCIRPGCYEFGETDLEGVAARFGPGVRATTTWGSPALDLPAAVAAALEEVGVERLHDTAGCTACDRRWFSHRARGEPQRVATLAWIEP
jgi:copper oxidase (laccase) domain-containing protein